MSDSRSAPKENPSTAEAAAAPPKFFFGWTIVGCAFTILCICYGIQFTYGVFMPFISASTGWDRASLSLGYSIYVFVYSALGIVSGRLTDRLGPRIVLMVGGCLLGAGVMLMSGVHALWQIYIVLGLIAAAGMSAAYVPCNATVVRWFTRRRGLALSITSSGSSFGTFIFPPLATALIALYGWRKTYLLLGLIAVVGVLSCATFIARDPEKMDLLPDGEATPEVSQSTMVTEVLSTENWTLAEAQRTRAFWLLNVIFTLTWLVVFIPMVHIVPFAIDLGISHFLAAMTISVIGIAGFAGRLAIGPISDRLGRVPSLALCLSIQVLAFLGFTFSTGLSLLYPAAAGFGLSYGGSSTLFPALVGDFFGRLAIGAIVGFIFALAGSSAAFGPFIAGYMYDATKSYHAAFVLSACLNLAALALLFALKKPTRTAS